MKNKLFIVTLLLCFIFCNLTTVFAAADTNVISIQEYTETLQNAYAKYNVEFEVLDCGDNVVITRDILNRDLRNVDKVAKSFKVVDLEVTVEDASPNFTDANFIVPLSMFYNKTVYVDWVIWSVYGNAGMRSKANVTIDGGNSQIAAVNSYSTYQYGVFINFDKWTTTSMSVTKNSPSAGYIKMVVKGKVTFSYADPVTGIKTGYTSTVSKTLQTNCI